jgi:hypothetical protein
VTEVVPEFDKPVLGYRVFRVVVAKDQPGEVRNILGELAPYPQRISKPFVLAYRASSTTVENESDPHLWRNAVKRASCVPGIKSGTDELIKVEPHTTSPAEACECGIYAFHDLGYAASLAHRGRAQDFGPRQQALVVGAVLGRGGVLLHNFGWRAEEARIIGLADWGSPLTRAAAKLAGQRLGVKVVPIDELRTLAESWGQTFSASDFRVERVEEEIYQRESYDVDPPQRRIRVDRLDGRRPVGFKAFRLIEPNLLQSRLAKYDDRLCPYPEQAIPEIKAYLSRMPIQLVSLFPNYGDLLTGSSHPAAFWHDKEKLAECVVDPSHVAPALDCECGISAVGDLTIAKRIARTVFEEHGASEYVSTRDLPTVIGVVAGYGDVVTCGEDWRAQSADLLALAVNRGTENKTTALALAQVARRLQVPVVSLARLRDIGRSKGAFLESA